MFFKNIFQYSSSSTDSRIVYVRFGFYDVQLYFMAILCNPLHKSLIKRY